MPPPRAPSVTTAFAARALVRITAAAPLVHDRLVGAATVMNHAQHVLSTIANEAETQRVISLRPVIRTGPGAPPGLGLQPLGTARPQPAINFRSRRGIARQAITTTTNNNNFAAAHLTSST